MEAREKNLPLFFASLVSEVLQKIKLSMIVLFLHYLERWKFLNGNFPNHWASRSGKISCRSLSPCLTQFNYFLWKYIKNKEYYWPPWSTNDLKNKARQNFAIIIEDILKKIHADIKFYLSYIAREIRCISDKSWINFLIYWVLYLPLHTMYEMFSRPMI